MVVQPDGKRVVVGRTAADANGLTEIALARFNPDGSLDTTFGNGGTVVTRDPRAKRRRSAWRRRPTARS